jgi:hypothetical protein
LVNSAGYLLIHSCRVYLKFSATLDVLIRAELQRHRRYPLVPW